MQRTFGPFLFITALILGLGLGEIAWTRLESATCQEWQLELQKRVDAYARMHLPFPAPQVQVQSRCGHAFVPDALFFRWHKLVWRFGWREPKPLEAADLRMSATRDLMQHPDMGTLRFTVRFDASLSRETRKRVEELIAHYLMIEEPRQSLEFKRYKKAAPNPAAQAMEPAAAVSMPSQVSNLPPALFPGPEPQLRKSLMALSNAAWGLILLSLSSFFLLLLLRPWRRLVRTRRAAAVAVPRHPSEFTILVAPRILKDLGERAQELWQLLLQLDRARAGQRILQAWEKDREGLLQFLGLLDGPCQESILNFLSTEQVLTAADQAQPTLAPREAQRASLRIVLDLARELGQCNASGTLPLFMQLLTRRDWQRLAQDLSRPRRRALTELLDKERGGWLRTRHDLQTDWPQAGSKEDISAEQLALRVRALLQADADQLREQLHADRDALQLIDSYFADLTLDVSLNSDLALLFLSSCLQRHASFGRLVQRRDPYLLATLASCDDQQLALLLYEGDSQIKNQVYAALGQRGEAVAALVHAMEHDRQHSKNLRMRARSLQRFIERQVLLADMLCAA